VTLPKLTSDPLTAAVIGGLLTGAATLLGALLIRGLDIDRENRKRSRQVVGAIKTVLAEIAANSKILKRYLASNSNTHISELPVSTEAYRRVELRRAMGPLSAASSKECSSRSLVGRSVGSRPLR
jgi:hypothetical protein